jgi:hypothetical protein
MCLAAALIVVMEGCQTLTFKRWPFWNRHTSLKPNGPAIKGGCITRRKHRAESWYFSQKAVTVQGGYGVVFAVRVQSWLSITSVAVQGY